MNRKVGEKGKSSIFVGNRFRFIKVCYAKQFVKKDLAEEISGIFGMFCEKV
jgi:hypothetical protein